MQTAAPRGMNSAGLGQGNGVFPSPGDGKQDCGNKISSAGPRVISQLVGGKGRCCGLPQSPKVHAPCGPTLPVVPLSACPCQLDQEPPQFCPAVHG